MAKIKNSIETINPLRKEKVIVRFVPNPSAMIQQKGHLLYGSLLPHRQNPRQPQR